MPPNREPILDKQERAPYGALSCQAYLLKPYAKRDRNLLLGADVQHVLIRNIGG